MRRRAEARRPTRAAWPVLASLLVVACSSGERSDPPPATAGEPQARAAEARPSAPAAKAKPASASAEEVAKEARGTLSCPPKIASEARAADAPVDDIVGVRPGLTYDEAAALVLCSNEMLVVTPEDDRGFRVETHGQKIRQGFVAYFADARVEKSAQDVVREMEHDFIARGMNTRREDMGPGKAKWFVSTVGLPDEERVVRVAREEWFPEGRNPPMDAVEKALVDKYGKPTERKDDERGRRVRWVYDPLGRAVTETSPLYSRCYGTADPDSGVNITPDCGIVVTAVIEPMRDNPGIARLLQVGVVDQARTFESIESTEQALLAKREERRAKELEEAAKSAAAPQL